MAADATTADRQTAAVRRASTVARWAVAAALCLAVAVYAWRAHGAMERRVAVLEAAVADVQRQLRRAESPSAAGPEQRSRNKRDATLSGQCLCPPGKCIVVTP